MKKGYHSAFDRAPVSLRFHSRTLNGLNTSTSDGACRGYISRSEGWNSWGRVYFFTAKAQRREEYIRMQIDMYVHDSTSF